jgi:hypothetical protein
MYGVDCVGIKALFYCVELVTLCDCNQQLVVEDLQPFPHANNYYPKVTANTNGDGTVAAASATGDRFPFAVRMGFRVSHKGLVQDKQVLSAIPVGGGAWRHSACCLIDRLCNVCISTCSVCHARLTEYGMFRLSVWQCKRTHDSDTE